MERVPRETRHQACRVALESEDSWMMRLTISMGISCESVKEGRFMAEGRRRVDGGRKEGKGELDQLRQVEEGKDRKSGIQEDFQGRY